MQKFKHFPLLIIALLMAGGSLAQSVDERLATAINSTNWYEMRQIYVREGHMVQTPMMHALTQFFIAHFYNRPDSAVVYGRRLLEKHQAEIGGSVGSVLYFMADDFARLGQFDEAAKILHAYNEAVKQAGAEPNTTFLGFERQYAMLHKAGGFSVRKPATTERIPLRYHTGRRESPEMVFVDATMNGKPVNATFDTGGGGNMLSEELARKLKLQIADSIEIEVSGIETKATRFAIVDSIRLGGILYRNVPFYVGDFRTGHKEADAKLKEMNFQCVFGSQMMMPLGEIRFDFARGEVIVPATPSPKPAYAPNMYRSEANQFIMDIHDFASGAPIRANLDTGGSHCSLSHAYYVRNKRLFGDAVPTDSVRGAGFGGVAYSKVFYTPLKYKLGERTAEVDSVSVYVTEDGNTGYDLLFGLPALTVFDCVTVNFTDMWVGVE